jgi:hypothetical protein
MIVYKKKLDLVSVFYYGLIIAYRWNFGKRGFFISSEPGQRGRREAKRTIFRQRRGYPAYTGPLRHSFSLPAVGRRGEQAGRWAGFVKASFSFVFSPE